LELAFANIRLIITAGIPESKSLRRKNGYFSFFGRPPAEHGTVQILPQEYPVLHEQITVNV
jgi:hypothetical protein